MLKIHLYLFLLFGGGQIDGVKLRATTDFATEGHIPLFQTIEKNPDQAEDFIGKIGAILSEQFLKTVPDKTPGFIKPNQKLQKKVASLLQQAQAVPLNTTFTQREDFAKLPVEGQRVLLEMGKSVKTVLGSPHLAEVIATQVALTEQFYKEHPEVEQHIKSIMEHARSVKDFGSNPGSSPALLTLMKKLPDLVKRFAPMIRPVLMPKTPSDVSLLQKAAKADPHLEDDDDDDGSNKSSQQKQNATAASEDSNGQIGHYVPRGIYARNEAGLNVLLPLDSASGACMKLIVNINAVKLLDFADPPGAAGLSPSGNAHPKDKSSEDIKWTERFEGQWAFPQWFNSSSWKGKGSAGFSVIPIGVSFTFSTFKFAFDFKTPIPTAKFEAMAQNDTFSDKLYFPHLKSGAGFAFNFLDSNLTKCKASPPKLTWFFATTLPAPFAIKSPAVKFLNDTGWRLIWEPMHTWGVSFTVPDGGDPPPAVPTAAIKLRAAMQIPYGGHQFFIVVKPAAWKLKGGSSVPSPPTGFTLGTIIHLCPDILGSNRKGLDTSPSKQEKDRDKLCWKLGYKTKLESTTKK